MKTPFVNSMAFRLVTPMAICFIGLFLYILQRETEPEETRLAKRLRLIQDLNVIAADIVADLKVSQNVPLLWENLPEALQAKLQRMVFWQGAHIVKTADGNTFGVIIIQSIHTGGSPVLCLHDGNAEDVPFGKGKRLIVATNVFVYPY